MRDELNFAFSTALRVSDFGDQALILPFAIGIGLLLALSGWRRGALTWAGAIGATLMLILLLKLRFFACGDILDHASRGNPSGHTAAAAAVYGALAGLVARAIWDNGTWSAAAAIVTALSVAAIIGQSRLLLDRHTVTEVVWGGGIGMAGAAGFAVVSGSPAGALRIGRIVLAGGIAIILLYGARISAEGTIKSIAPHLWPLSQCI